ncbi:M56 family metallopeptidase [Niabella drilacis]|uniref:BlaR1 peptidase M56 n=1 Tax=Niabella drilacis (strain DSM 25811 / CCM 8410 / CCUG 62505 / LMG 26954 / E90) TaxID=1285928 RepID=A0A1G6V5A9_NIADE|nr:M56 family metallopeptidase [Niabella drilacis]SDD48634.1 BlaR1 peptidase M56 [Niabella drilacis]
MEWFAYLLKVSACTALFFGFYLLILRQLTFFRINRIYLLASLLLSCVIPMVHISIKKAVPFAPVATVVPGEPVILKKTMPPVPQVPEQVKQFDWQAAAGYLYMAIVLTLLLLSVWRLLRILKYVKHPVRTGNGLRLISKRTGFTNCSFFNYVFVDESTLSNAELELFLKHEEVHAKQFHSADKMLMILAKAIMWMNPVIYLYDKALTQAHEYEADAITSQHFGKESYARLILNRAIGAPKMALAHQFAESPVKERIKMLFTPKSNKMKQLSYAFILPIGAGLIALFGIQFVAAQQTPLPLKTTKKATAVTITDKEVGAPRATTTSTDKTKAGNHTRIVADTVIVDDLVPGNIAQGTVDVNWKNAPRAVTIQHVSVVDETVIRPDENTGCRITGIDNDAKYTIVSFEYTAAHENDWALLNKEIYLQANDDMKHFQYVKSEGIPLAPYRHNFTRPGEKIAFKIYFEKVPLTAKSIDVIERAGRSDFFNFYGVPLPASYFAQQ